MRKILSAFALLFLCASGWAQTATVTGQINDPATSGQSVNTFLRFELKGCAGNQPRYNGTALLWPVIKKYQTSSLGAISGTIYRNDYITCGSSTASNYWAMTVIQNGQTSAPCNVRIAAATFDATQPNCLNQNPTVAVPTDSTLYALLDNSNGPFTGNLQAKKLENVRLADQFLGADCGLKISAADADLGVTAGEIWVNQSCGTTAWSDVTLSTNRTLRFIQGGTYNIGKIIAPGGSGIDGTGSNTVLRYSGTNNCALTLGHAASTGSGANGVFARNFNLNIAGLTGVKAVCLAEAEYADLRNIYAQVETAGGVNNTNVGFYDDGDPAGGTSFGNNWNYGSNLSFRYFNTCYKTNGTAGTNRIVASTQYDFFNCLNNNTAGAHDGTTGIYVTAGNGNGLVFHGGEDNGLDIGARIAGFGVSLTDRRYEISASATANIQLDSGALAVNLKGLWDLSNAATALVDNSGAVGSYQITGSFYNDKTAYQNVVAATTLTGNITFDVAANRNILLNQTNTGTKALTIQGGAGSAAYGGSVILYGHSHATAPGWVRANISSGSGGKFAVNNSGLGAGTDVFTVDTNGAVVANSTVTATQLISNVSTGTAPLTVSSTTKVSNLNVDQTDGVSLFRFAATLSPALVAANTCAEETFTVTGIAAGDYVFVNKPTAQAGLGVAGVRAVGANQAAINFCNNTAAGITPTASQSYVFGVLR